MGATKNVTVTDTDGNEVRVEVKRLRQNDQFQFVDMTSKAKDRGELYVDSVEFIIKRGVEGWDITDEAGKARPVDMATIRDLDVTLVENIIGEVKAFNPAIFPDGRRVTGEAALGMAVSDGLITKEQAMDVLSKCRHDRPMPPQAT